MARRHPYPELRPDVQVGTRWIRICKCGTPYPGVYTVVRIGAARKMAWLHHDLTGFESVARCFDFGEERSWDHFIPAAAGKGGR